MSNPAFEQATLPNFNAIDPAQIEPSMRKQLEQNKEKLSTLLAQPIHTWDNLMQPMEDMNDELSKKWSPIAHLHAVMESEDLRAAYNQVLPLLTEYHIEMSHNEKLFAATTAITNNSNFPNLNAAQHKIIENDLRDFKLAGINLPQNKKDRITELQKNLSLLMTKFSENVLDATHGFFLHVTDDSDIEGLPPQAVQLALDNAKNRKLPGYVFTLDYPSYSTAIRFLKKRELRKQLYEAYATRASDQGPNSGKWDNTPIIEDILKTRHEIAQLVGFNNYAEYSLATKMAKTPDEVLAFLNDLFARSKSLAQKELQEVIALAKKIDNLSTLEVWDMPYYSECLQHTKFNFTQEDFRPYFPVHVVLEGMFTVIKKLYGLKIQAEKNIEVWHPHVRFFSIFDANNNLRGGLYTDLYAREHKRDGAWMDECRTRRRLQNNKAQHPVAYLTCNFMPPVNDQPALLTHDDVLTLFHEFGHCLHHILTQVDYPSVAGINGVAWDAVEFPSQFLENYCWEQETLSFIAKHYQTGAPFPDDLYQKMHAAKNFQTGLQMIRQLEFALFDFRLHLEYGSRTGQVQALLNEIRKQAGLLPIPEFNRFQHSFSHIFGGGYTAGYYSYKWAEVLSADAYAKFEENGIFDTATGMSFMQNILEVGGVPDAMDAFIAFRGRKPNIDALLKQSGINS